MRIRDFVGVLSPSTLAVAYPSPADPPPSTSVVPGALAGLAAMSMSKQHPFLAFLAGDAIGGNAYRLWRGRVGDRSRVFGNIGVTAAIIGGSLLMPRRPFAGGVAGFVAGVLATSLVRGTLANSLIFGAK